MDVVYAGNPRKGVDRWYNHEAALRAAQQFNDNPFQFKGGHMLKRQPKFQKGDYVEVRFSKKWHAATIIKRKQVNDDFRYVNRILSVELPVGMNECIVFNGCPHLALGLSKVFCALHARRFYARPCE